jgi:integrase
MKLRKSTKTWLKTRKSNLLRHKSGCYYARAFAGGKEVWRSLKTSHYSVAQAKLEKFLGQQRQARATENPEVSPRTTFREAVEIHLRRIADDVAAERVKASTEHYWRQIFIALRKSWPELWGRQLRGVTKADCEAWARRFVKQTGSATRFNNTVAGLRHVFAVAVESGAIYTNPAVVISEGRRTQNFDRSSPLRRLSIRQRHLDLPSTGQFLEMLSLIRTAGGGVSRHCGDFVEGLAFTGMRKSEANALEWRDVDFDAGEIVVRGDSKTGTKNWELHRVPMVRDARALFQRMRNERAGEPLTKKVFRVREAQRAIDTACKKLGIPRITHHDLRHLFATRCIESGVDIPTVSRWLNHKDGGKLAMKTYGHLRREHSIAQAQRVTFAPAVTEQADVIAFPATA